AQDGLHGTPGAHVERRERHGVGPPGDGASKSSRLDSGGPPPVNKNLSRSSSLLGRPVRVAGQVQGPVHHAHLPERLLHLPHLRARSPPTLGPLTHPARRKTPSAGGITRPPV